MTQPAMKKEVNEGILGRKEAETIYTAKNS